ncbi:MAG: MvaI/BcnI restriction endonuclease family protein [Prevotella sp.]|nr:MvaI/BcnI restriction endonuclease family protein [Prevotella sp.]
MKSDKDRIIERFHQIKDLGFVKSNRKNNTGIGKTFEDYMGVVENNLDKPYLFGFEIKSHREETNSYITLFTKSPNFPQRANAWLNLNYGIPYEENPQLHKLHTSMFADKYNTFNEQYSFRLINDTTNNLLRIGIFDINTKKLINADAGYTYKCIETVLRNKLHNLFYVSANRKYIDNDEYFHFNMAEIFSNPTIERFLKLVDAGKIMYDIRIGSYKSGANYGKPHDHGSGFRILEPNLKLLFQNREEVN